MTGTRALASDPDIVNASAEHSPPLVSVVSTGPRRVNVSKSNRRKHTSEKAAGKPKRNILFRMENQQLNVRVLVVPDSDFPMVNEQSALDVCGAGKSGFMMYEQFRVTKSPQSELSKMQQVPKLEKTWARARARVQTMMCFI